MKILMTGLLPVNLGEVKGGVVSVILNFLEAYSRMPEVEVIHVSYNEEIKARETARYSSNVTVIYLPFKSRFALLDYVINRRSLRSIISDEQPDVVHIQEVTPQLFRFLFLNRDRVVVTQHGIMRMEYKTAIGLAKKMKSLFKGQVERFIFPLYRNIIFISEYNKRLFNGTPVRQALIFNPVNRIFIDTDPGPGAANHILYVGVINVNKNIRMVLDAMGRLKLQGINYHLHVVGGYKDADYEPVIRQVVEDNGVGAMVTFHGWKRQDEILALHSRCAIYIHPSLQENMPVSIAESMATGRVVIASDVGAISEMFSDGVSGFLFPSGDTERLCGILTTLHRDPGLITRVSSAARAEARKKFHPERIAEQTLDFLNKVAGTSARPLIG